MTYKVTWLDIQGHYNEDINKPYNEYLCECYTIGEEIIADETTTLVIYGGSTEDDEKSFDAIPNGCITNIQQI